MFRGKSLDGLARLREKGQLVLPKELEPAGAFERLVRHLWRTRWLTYCKRPFAGPEQVFKYLGRYTHRVGLSNRRLLHVDDLTVTLSTRDGKHASMAPLELVRRFLTHVLPRGYVKIRHYVLLASSNVRTRLERAREAIGAGKSAASKPGGEKKSDWRARLLELTGTDVTRCPVCGGMLQLRLAPAPPLTIAVARGPPISATEPP